MSRTVGKRRVGKRSNGKLSGLFSGGQELRTLSGRPDRRSKQPFLPRVVNGADKRIGKAVNAAVKR